MQRSIEDQVTGISTIPVPVQPSPDVVSSVAPNSSENLRMVGALMRSKIFLEYGQAFTCMTGLSIALIPLTTNAANEESLANPLANPCFITVPINVKSQTIGYLQAGLMTSLRPTDEQFERFVQNVELQGIPVNRDSLKHAFFAAAVLSPKTLDSARKLLTILAQHLGMLGGQVSTPLRAAEPSAINRARAYIQEHLSEKIYLAQVAKVANLNSFYFCKIFKRITGFNFTDYVAQLRVEKSKALLTNAELSVTDVAFASGFHSLTHFNRVFKKITGLSPTAFRTQIIGG